MAKRLAVVAGCLCLAACQRKDVKVLIGATAIVEPGVQPVGDSIVIVSGRTIRAVGARKDIPIPQDSERTDLSGKWVIPAAGARIAAGESANLLVLSRAPDGATPRAPDDISQRIVAGEWR